MVHVNSGAHHFTDAAANLGNAPGQQCGLVDVLLVTGEVIVAESGKVVYSAEGASVEDLNGVHWLVIDTALVAIRDHLGSPVPAEPPHPS